MSDKINNLSSIMEGYNPQRQLLEQTRELVKKWEPTGLLEGITDENKTHGMAVLLENQARQLIDEASRTNTGGSAEEWSGVALPLVRRIFGELAAQEFVSVQPMNLPSGLIFYLDFKYSTDQTTLHTDGSDVFGNTSGSNTDATGGLYGAGKFGYSINDQVTGALSGHATTEGTSAFTTGSVVWEDVDFEPDLSASVAIGSTADNGLVKLITDAVDSYTRPDFDGVRAFVPSGSAGLFFDEFYPAYTKYDSTNNRITFIVKKSATGVGGNVTVKYHQQPVETNRGDFEQTAAGFDENAESDIGIPEIDINLKQIPIVAKTRKLKAVWSPELAQDLNAYHSVDAEAELTAMLSEYISMEIDLEILDMLMANASAKKERWSAKVGFEYDAATSVFSQVSANSNAYTKGEWFQTLGNKIQAVSNAIHQKTLRGGANFLVVSPETATIIESIPGYAADTTGDATQSSFAMGVQRIGALNNRYTVYKNPYMLENSILVGFRGTNFLETGAVYAPYVPLIMTPLVYDPKNFTPRKGVMTRYAKKMVRPEFYGKVVVADVNLV